MQMQVQDMGTTEERTQQTIIELTARHSLSLSLAYMLEAILKAPTIIEGFASKDGISRGLFNYLCIRDFGGAVLLRPYVWAREPDGSMTPGSWEASWYFAVPKLGQEYVKGTSLYAKY